MLKWILSVFLVAFGANAVAADSQDMPMDTPSQACVILLHGMGRTKASMRKLEKHLIAQGFQTQNEGYPSTKVPIETIAQRYIPAAIAKCRAKKARKIHFVTHSLGGIVLRHYLQNDSLPQGSRAVMISPPNQGSEVAQYLKNCSLYKWMMGPAGQQLGTKHDPFVKTLAPVDVEVGIITGDRSLNPLFSSLLPGPDDGKVSVQSAKLKEMRDFLVVKSSHAFIMRNPRVMAETVHFLEHGHFRKENADGLKR